MVLVVKRTVSDKTSLLFSSNFWKDEEKQETNVPTNCKSTQFGVCWGNYWYYFKCLAFHLERTLIL